MLGMVNWLGYIARWAIKQHNHYLHPRLIIIRGKQPVPPFAVLICHSNLSRPFVPFLDGVSKTALTVGEKQNSPSIALLG